MSRDQYLCNHWLLVAADNYTSKKKKFVTITGVLNLLTSGKSLLGQLLVGTFMLEYCGLK